MDFYSFFGVSFFIKVANLFFYSMGFFFSYSVIKLIYDQQRNKMYNCIGHCFLSFLCSFWMFFLQEVSKIKAIVNERWQIKT